MAKYETHDFYCLNCGEKSIPIMRKEGRQHGAMHRKKLWCWKCKMEINHIECRSFEEIETFKQNFIEGVYKDEAAESISHVRACGIG